jgi:hypothetical protein
MELCLLSGQQTADPIILNLETGLSNTMMDKIVDHKVRQQALDKQGLKMQHLLPSRGKISLRTAPS